ncbi:MAG: ABC transporter permease, partial [Nitrososphaerota archaeon]|nr:ABC transporter permease [Nitrososphaerota archaeon]
MQGEPPRGPVSSLGTEQRSFLHRFITSAVVVAEMEARKIRHASSELWIRGIQPALWLLVFGSALAGVRDIAPSQFSYIQFITPGILSQSVLFIAIFYGVTLVWERDLGLLNKLLATPAPRPSIIVGKAMAASIRGIFQALLVFALSLIIGTGIDTSPLNVLGVFGVVILLAMCFSSLSMVIASIARTRDRMMGLSQVIIFPLFFASNAIYPTKIMPAWLQLIATINPLSYGVQAVRALLLTGNFAMLSTDVAFLAGYTVAMLVLASLSLR